MSLTRTLIAAVLVLALAGCEIVPSDSSEANSPERLSPAVASLRAWMSTSDSVGFLPSIRDSLAGSTALLAGTHQVGERPTGRRGFEFNDSTIVLLELSATSWDSAMSVANAIVDRYLDEMAPAGEPLTMQGRESLPLGGAKWRWLSGGRVGELRLRGVPRPGWPRNTHWAISIALTDRPATAYDRGVRPRKVTELSRAARWFEGLLDKGTADSSPLVRWAMAAGASGTGMDGRSASTEGGRFAETQTLTQKIELLLELDGVEPDSIARALAPQLEAELIDAVGVHGTTARVTDGRWSYAGRGRAGTLDLGVQRDSGGRCWAELTLEDTPADVR